MRLYSAPAHAHQYCWYHKGWPLISTARAASSAPVARTAHATRGTRFPTLRCERSTEEKTSALVGLSLVSPHRSFDGLLGLAARTPMTLASIVPDRRAWAVAEAARSSGISQSGCQTRPAHSEYCLPSVIACNDAGYHRRNREPESHERRKLRHVWQWSCPKCENLMLEDPFAPQVRRAHEAIGKGIASECEFNFFSVGWFFELPSSTRYKIQPPGRGSASLQSPLCHLRRCRRSYFVSAARLRIDSATYRRFRISNQPNRGGNRIEDNAMDPSTTFAQPRS